MKNLGIDVGGVIISRANDDTDTSFFSDNYLATTPEIGAFESINAAFARYDNIYIVSKCGDNVRRKTLEWFKHHNFYGVTGVKEENVFFCRKRNEKVGICEQLGITTFVDDRLEILNYMLDKVDNLYLFKPQDSEIDTVVRENGKNVLSRVHKVNSWKEFDTLENNYVSNTSAR